MAVEIQSDLSWEEETLEEMTTYHRPSKPVLEEYVHTDEWVHEPNAKTVPDWVLPVLVLIALALFVVLVQSGTLKPLLN